MAKNDKLPAEPCIREKSPSLVRSEGSGVATGGPAGGCGVLVSQCVKWSAARARADPALGKANSWHQQGFQLSFSNLYHLVLHLPEAFPFPPFPLHLERVFVSEDVLQELLGCVLGKSQHVLHSQKRAGHPWLASAGA